MTRNLFIPLVFLISSNLIEILGLKSKMSSQLKYHPCRYNFGENNQNKSLPFAYLVN